MASGQNIGSLYWSTGVDFSGFKRDTNQAKGALSGLFKPSIIGATALAAAIIKVGDAALDFSREFETAFSEVQTISQSARENADAMRESILKMTSEIPVGAIDSTKALYQIVSAGFDGADAMNLLRVSAKAAVAGVSDTATAADTLTTIINAYGKSADEAIVISDALFKTVELGKTTLSEIGGSFSQIASLAANYNIELNDVLTATAELTSQGASTSEAITRIRGAVVSVSKEFGSAAFEGRTLAEAFQLARDEADKSGEGYEKFFGRVEAVLAILGLTGEGMDSFNEKLEKVNNSADSTEKALTIMNGTFDSQYKLLKNNIIVEFSGFGNLLKGSLMPVLRSFNDLLSDDSPAKAIKEQTQQINSLVLKLSDLTISEDERRKIIDEINKIQPQLLQGLTDEEIKTDNLTQRIKEYNLEQLNRIVISKEQAKIDEAIGKRNEALIKQRESESKLALNLSKFVTELNLNKDAVDFFPAYVNQVNDVFQSAVSNAEKAKEIFKVQANQTRLLSLEDQARLRTSTDLTDALSDYNNAQRQILKSDVQINQLTESRDKIAESLGVNLDKIQKSAERASAEVDLIDLGKIDDNFDSLEISDGINKISRSIKDIDDEIDLLSKAFEESGEDSRLEIAKNIAKLEDEKKAIDNLIESQLKLDRSKKTGDIPTAKINPIIATSVERGDKTKKEIQSAIDKNIELINIREDLSRRRVSLDAKDFFSYAKSELEKVKISKDANTKKIKELKKLDSVSNNIEIDSLSLANDELDKIADETKAKLIHEVSSELSVLSSEISEFNPELGESVDKMGKFTSILSNMISGNLVGSISGGISLIASLFSKNKDDLLTLGEEYKKFADSVEGNIGAVSIALESLNRIGVSGITKTSRGIDSFVSTNQIGLNKLSGQISSIAKEAAELNESLDESRNERRTRQPSSLNLGQTVQQISSINEEIETLSLLLLQTTLSDDQREAIESVLNSYISALDQIDTITQDITGTTVSDLSSSLADAFLAGEYAAESWGEAVDDIIKNVITDQLTTKLLITPINDAISELIKDTDEDFTIGEADKFKKTIEELASSVSPAFEAARKALSGIGIEIGNTADQTEEKAGISGAIRAELSEETGGILQGIWRRHLDETLAHTDIMNTSNSYLSLISDYTLRTAIACESLDYKIESGQDGRDLGV